MRRRIGIFMWFVVAGLAVLIAMSMFDARTILSKPSVERMIPDALLPQKPVTILFIGDVMLGRLVRQHMRANGPDYPFEKLGTLFTDVDAVIANLEGPITLLDAPDTRVSPEQPFSMRFAFDPESAGALARAGITHVSLANNHALDQGSIGQRDTIAHLTDAGVIPFGAKNDTPLGVTTTLTLSGRDIRVVGLDATIARHDWNAITDALKEISENTTILVFMHWGNEYETTHSEEQEAIARTLVGAGADAIIGAHPHVIQDIQTIDGAPVFYSLGNFIFDQYWDESVRDGLAVKLTIDGDDISYETIPITRDYGGVQPFIKL